PGDRRPVPDIINMHSVKNRFLMRVKNLTPGLFRRYSLPMTGRGLLVAGGCLFYEPVSALACWHVARCLPRALRQRRIIMSRRRTPDASLVLWFSLPSAPQAPPPFSRGLESAVSYGVTEPR